MSMPRASYLVKSSGATGENLFRCTAHYGYRADHQDVNSFESELVGRQTDFVYYD